LARTREAKPVDTARSANQATAKVIPLPRVPAADGRQSWAASAPIASTGWSLLAIVDEERLLTTVRARLWRQAMAYGLGTIAALSLLWWMSGVATRPLIPLGTVARQVAAGDLGARVKRPSRQDEIGRFATVFNRMMDDLQANIAGRLEATAARQAVESELELALKIQKTLLPGPFPADDAVHIATGFLPAKYVAGDFYDHFRLGPDTLVVAVADVSGKGVAAALFMAAARTALRNFSRTGVSPAETLEGVNRSLCAENRHVMFVTAFVGHYHIPSGRLVYANAGHNIPYRVRPGAGADPLGDATGPLLAVFEDARFANREMQLSHGDTLVLYTDGVVEAADAGGTLYGDERLEGLLGRHAESSADALCSAVADSVLSYCNGAPQDDVTLLVLRCSKANRAAPSPAV
jgi:sigma-B regulation protein RsbU (phosphoserine phosphatase)